MRILYISQRVPFPPNRGDKISTWRHIDRLRQHHEVIALAFAHDDAYRKAAEDLRAMGIETHTVDLNQRKAKLKSLPLLLTNKPLTLGVFGSRAMQALVDGLAPSADLLIGFSSSMGAFILPHNDKPRIQFVVELDSDKWAQYAGFTKVPMKFIYAREARTLLAFERKLCHAVDMSVLVTPLEERIFHERIPGAAAMTIRNGVDLEQFHPRNNVPEPAHFVFTGVMDYFPNVDGCVWFAKAILPLIRKAFPEAHFTIVGNHPTPEIQALGTQPGIHVTGFVPETRDYLARAAVAVAPLRIARGIQNKVLEAMSMGLAVVGTTHATQGVDGRHNGEYLVADDAESFAEACILLLNEPHRAKQLGARARAFVEEHYQWERVLEPLDTVVADVVRNFRPTP